MRFAAIIAIVCYLFALLSATVHDAFGTLIGFTAFGVWVRAALQEGKRDHS